VFADQFGRGPRSTPTLDGDRVYMLGSKGKLVAFRTVAGGAVWTVDLTERFGAPVPRFGFGGSPLVVEDLVLIEVGGRDDAWLAALDRDTGETRWTALSGPAGYCSPILVEIDGGRQIVLARGKTVTSLDLEGDVLWTHELQEPAIAMPIDLGGGRVFVSSIGDTGCSMLRARKTPDGGFEVEPVWSNRNLRTPFSSAVAHDGHIYGFDNATLKCISSETGEVSWAKRGFGKGSLLVAGGHLVVLSDRGKVVMVEATPEGYREVGSFQALDGKSWTAPAMADGRLYLRNLEEMACLELGGRER